MTSDAAGKTAYTTAVPASALRISIAQLRPGDSAGDSSYWVNYVNSSKTRTTANDPKTGKPFGTTAAGYKMNQPGQELATAGTLTSTGSGAYRYVSNIALTNGIDISANNTDVALLPNGGKYAYNAALTHRVVIEVRPGAGTMGDATMGANNAAFDFVPDGKTAKVTREVVNIANCNDGCHKTLGMHGGPRLDVKLCVTCHNPTNGDPESGNNLDLKVMVHKIHAGKVLPSVNLDKSGEFTSLYKTDPAGAVKGTPYRIWGYNNTLFDASEILIPSNPANCVMCHKNAVDADNYKTKPTKEACGSCHDGINFATGKGKRMWFSDSKITMAAGVGGAEVSRADVAGFEAQINAGHKGGAVSNNAACAICHTADGTQASPDASPAPVTAVHGEFSNSYALGWSKAKTDYTIDLSLSAPANGTHYVTGEKPVVTIVLKDAATGTAIDHTKISDAASSDFGAGALIVSTGRIYGLKDATGANTNAGASVNGTLGLYVSGPRALRKPVLTTIPAWNKGFFSVGTGNTYTGNAAIDLRARTTSTTLAASATIPASFAGTYSNKMAQDDYQVTYDAAGVATATPAKVTGVISRTDPTKLQYQLAPIPADMTPGTYVVMLLAAKKSTAGVVPKAMSLALTTFNVGQATEEKKIAFGCPECHSTTVWHDNAVNGANGSHPAKFDPDYCGSCHDYAAPISAIATGAVPTTAGGKSYKVAFDPMTGEEIYSLVNGTGVFPAGSGQAWVNGGNKFGFGTTPISRRVHGVHAGGTVRTNGSPMINYPYEVYNGENVTIAFPQDVRNCEKCHNSTTSGTWKTKPSRVACLACHDSDAAYAHAALQTLDSTPAIGTTALVAGSTASATPTSGPFNGDEIESCPVCHAAK